MSDKADYDFSKENGFLIRAKGGDEWTPNPPTKPGWYWVSIFYENHGRHSHIIYVDEKQTYSAPTDYDSEIREHVKELGDSALWLGPLPVPEPPKG